MNRIDKCDIWGTVYCIRSAGDQTDIKNIQYFYLRYRYIYSIKPVSPSCQIDLKLCESDLLMYVNAFTSSDTGGSALHPNHIAKP